MEIKTIYEDNDVLVVDKPAGITVIPDLIDILAEQYPELKKVGEAPRHGIVHRLDKNTSGVLLVAKNAQALIFLQKQFKNKTTGAILSASLGNKNFDSNSLALLDNREVEKKYTALTTGVIKEDSGEIKTLVTRSKGDPRRQIVSGTGREAITQWKVIERFADYTLLEVKILTGRRHQIRCHLSYIHHPIAGDKLYGFKDSPCPKGLTRQFLHANYLKIKIPSGQTHEFQSNLPEELENVLKSLEKKDE